MNVCVELGEEIVRCERDPRMRGRVLREKRENERYGKEAATW